MFPQYLFHQTNENEIGLNISSEGWLFCNYIYRITLITIKNYVQSMSAITDGRIHASINSSHNVNISIVN